MPLSQTDPEKEHSHTWGKRPLKQKYFAATTILLSVVMTLAAAEVGVRITVPRKLWAFTDATDDWQVDSQVGWINRGNARTESMVDTGLVSFATNADGILPSSALRERHPGVRRVMLFGDSAVLGRAVAEQNRIHSRLQQLLSSPGQPVEVLNAAVQGYSTDQVLLLMKRLIPVYEPDVVVYGLCQNDFEGNAWTKNYGVGKPKCEVVNGLELRIAEARGFAHSTLRESGHRVCVAAFGTVSAVTTWNTCRPIAIYEGQLCLQRAPARVI
jgi:hypothetical protein